MTAQYGPHRWSAGEHDSTHTDRFRRARFEVNDLTGARFVDCDLTGVKIVDSWLVGMDLSGFVAQLVVNGVDVTAYVEAELDKRHPERVQLREMRTAEDYRSMARTLDGLWVGAVARAERLTEAQRQEQVDDEWSITETLRHLIFIVDSWASRTVLDEPRPFHPLALPQTAYPPADAAALGMDLTARPSFAEVLAVRAERAELVRGILAGLTDEELGRECTRSPAPGYPEENRPVGECLEVVLMEETEHYRYAIRDLAVLEQAGGQSGNRS
jgi:hypothetical protein